MRWAFYFILVVALIGYGLYFLVFRARPLEKTVYSDSRVTVTERFSVAGRVGQEVMIHDSLGELWIQVGKKSYRHPAGWEPYHLHDEKRGNIMFVTLDVPGAPTGRLNLVYIKTGEHRSVALPSSGVPLALGVSAQSAFPAYVTIEHINDVTYRVRYVDKQKAALNECWTVDFRTESAQRCIEP